MDRSATTRWPLRSPHLRWMVPGVILLAALVLGLAAGPWASSPTRALTAAQDAFARQDYRTAAQHARQAWAHESRPTEAALLAGRSAAALGRFEDALHWFGRIPDDRPEALAARLDAAAVLLLRLKRLSQAESQLRRALALDGDHHGAVERMAFVMGLSNRTYEAVPYRLALVRSGRFDPVHLYLLSLGDKAVENPDAVAEYHRAAPSDPLPQLALARAAIEEQDTARAAALLEPLVAAHPHLVAAHVKLGRVYLDRESTADFARWQSRLPTAARRHPEIWALQGLWAQRQDQPQVAIRCFLEALRLDPAHETANYQLGQLLVAQGETERAQPFLERARRLQEYGNAVKVAWRGGDPQALVHTAELAESLGLLWEAAGWSQLAVKSFDSQVQQPAAVGAALRGGPRSLDAEPGGRGSRRAATTSQRRGAKAARREPRPPNSAGRRGVRPLQEAARSLRQRLEPRLDGLPLTRVAPQVDLVARFDVAAYPLPASEPDLLARSASKGQEPDPSLARRASQETHPTPGDPPLGGITFEDRAAAAGIDFRYFNDASPAGAGAKMYEFTGGGVGVLDYDQDGWPDLHLTQGCRWPERGRQTRHLDQLYRNAGGGRFENVTAAAGLVENGYSQGVTVGDYNSDGFPDLYVANIGRNRLYRNNGDGTFTDVTDQSGTAGAADDWTTSCLLADLNGDALPDLYAVNYLTGPDVFERVCTDGDGTRRSCLPQHFDAAQDRIYLNRGDGRFEERTDAAGIVVPDGKGLGIVAADLDGTGRLSLFVANDAVPNFLFINQGEPAGPLRFQETALTRGVALNRLGRVEACMGVAAGDSDGDGRVDLFVTNFHRETNTLYRQSAGGFFADATPEAGLEQPSLPMLGFGTQFLDGELDGHLDLIVTNGHVDDRRDLGEPWTMPPQYFRNRGDGRFQELPAARLGPFFSRPVLGRGLARLDWNRDGLEDVAIGHLDAPAALLTNTTRDHGSYLTLRLHGTTSNRDALGATVTAHVAGRTITRHLSAGDGYHASNQRRLVFGLAAATRVEQLHVRWPSGRIQEFTGVPINCELCLVEGRPAYLRIDAP